MKRLEKFLSEELSIKDTVQLVGKFTEFEKLLLEWNSKINLVSRKINTIEDQILSSIFFLTKIHFENFNNICDVGTGGGFPGIPLKIIFPDKNFVLVDSIGKKVTAVNSIMDELGLKKIECLNSRAEKLAESKHYKRKFDIVISKAVSTLTKLYSWCNPLIKENYGYMLCIKGGDVKDELNELKTNFPDTSTGLFDFCFDRNYGIEDKKVVTIKSVQ